MKNCLLILSALTFISWTAPGQPNPTSTEPEIEQAIGQLREGLLESFNHGDIDRLLTFLDTNVVVTWQNGEVCEGPAAVKTYYQRMMQGDHPVVTKVTSAPKILGRHVQRDWAVSWGNLNDTFLLTDGRELPLNSRFTAALVKRGDRWLVAAFHVSVNAFDNPVMTLAVKKISMFAGMAALLVGLLVGALGSRLLWRPKKTGA